jgi:hypothetical protein
MSLTKLCLAGRVWLVTSRLGRGKIINLFYCVYSSFYKRHSAEQSIAVVALLYSSHSFVFLFVSSLPCYDIKKLGEMYKKIYLEVVEVNECV